MTSIGDQPRRIVIVGAGHGGGTVAALLRQQRFAGEIVVVGAEPVGPYHRPPLSKSLLRGDLEQPLQPRDFYREQQIELRTGTRVETLDRMARRAHLSDGGSIDYDVAILATGAKARRLEIPGRDLEKVYELRTIAHARVLHDVLTPGRHLAVVGGGWIGLEVAASALAAGVQVTVIEREERLLARVASPELSRHLSECHTGEGTRILTSARVSGLESGPRGQVVAVTLEDGETIPCDRVLIGVGAVADDELARAAGLRCEDGVVVDDCGRTEDPYVYAVGDVTRRPVPLHEGLLRVESIPSAVEQARQAVAAILGAVAPAPEVPWFWSDQFDLKLQIAGLLRDTDRATVRADPALGKFVVFHTRGGRLIAVEGVNAAAEFMAGKRLIRDQPELDLDRLADGAVALDAVALPAPAFVGANGAPAPPIAAAEPATAANGDAPGDAVAFPGPGGTPGEPRATFIQPDGSVTSVDIPAGLSLMDGSIRNNLPGILAECGGMCSCGTCHVFVEPGWQERLPEPEYEEDELLEFLEGRQPNSRLSCQIVMDDGLDGIVVRVAGTAG
ncbi:MAG: 3-phenylpropionate/trans-cinnamate dioxygenase ferredoxin reductase component [Chloroflexota bacterium]|nr:3-phenylpropionate/trans-cinnamate dioxygenase ferredoxin reductase component [Chloroflexota bacterium]